MKSIQDLQRLDGRVAVITGGAGHVGLIAAEVLRELGATIILLDKDETRLDRGKAYLEDGAEPEIFYKACDLTDVDDIESSTAAIVDEFGKVNILINAAGLVGTANRHGWIAEFEKQEIGPWNEALQVNVSSIFLLTKQLAKTFRSVGGAAIVNIGSIYGTVGPDLRLYEGTSLGSPAAYAASKGGVKAITKWLATALAPDIRVNLISPGGIWRGQDETFVRRYMERTPLRRMATEQDLKGAIAYFASDMSAYVTGQELFVDGGWTAW
jgi:NAD(P)-dependent dehydrogenase (short-subunit alcohol dehydrogenase family)